MNAPDPLPHPATTGPRWHPAPLLRTLGPVFGTLLSITILGETLEVFHIVALVLVLGGIAIAEWGKPAMEKPSL